MSVKYGEKTGIEFVYAKSEDSTIIHAIAQDSELPEIMARLEPGLKPAWKLRIRNYTKHTDIFEGVCPRGRAFAEKVAREIIRGCFSRLGKRRRMAANKAKKAEVK